MMTKKISVRYPRRSREKGFALIAALLLMMLISALAIGLLMMVNTETIAGGNDLQNNVAFHAAEGGLEKMTSDLAGVFTSIQAPNKNDIEGVSALLPTTPGITYPGTTADPGAGYKVQVTAPVKADGVTVIPQWGIIKSGPNKDLSAQIIPVRLTVTAQAKLENQVSMTRTAEIALIPVFQFGVFCDGDCSFFNSPDMTFAGRVHTNNDLYLGVSSGSTINFRDKLSAYGNIIRQQLPNGLDSTARGNTGTVNVPTTSGGCGGSNCQALSLTQGSVTGGPLSGQNPAFSNLSSGTYHSMIIHGDYGKPDGTGAICLTLPFTGVSGKTCATAPGQPPNYPSSNSMPFEIIRRPPALEDTTTALGQARYFNNAEIRILLADDPAENHLDGTAVDSQDIRLANVTNPNGAPDYSTGVPVGGVTGNVFFAEGTTDQTKINESNWQNIPGVDAGIKCYPSSSCVSGAGSAPKISATTWNLIDGYLRVEIKKTDGTWLGVTKEWLEYGFARGYDAPAPGGTNPNAILVLQQLADRNGNGTADAGAATPANVQGPSACLLSNPYVAPSGAVSCTPSGVTSTCSGGKKKWTLTCTMPSGPPELATDTTTGTPYTGTNTRNNWYPINLYDPREGETRDNLVTQTAGSCGVAGIMNIVELDMGNLKKWLAGTAPYNTGNGANVESVADNGYILYYSDRRGMVINPNVSPNRKTGDSGLEDVVNSAAGTGGTPDGVLESPTTSGGKASPEDVNLNGSLDAYGPTNMGLGFGPSTDSGSVLANLDINSNASKRNPYKRIPNCLANGRPNWVSGARHGLRLVDGSLGNVPTRADGTGGFTVTSENPVYILGNYNSASPTATPADTAWNSGGAEPAHSAAAIIADSVSLLSNSWRNVGGNNGDYASFASPFTNRPNATTTYYRVAIAGGKNRTFPFPSWATTTVYGFGTDGGVHNFLRFLEDWTGTHAWYKGSMVSLYYSTYNTGLFKCCGDAVYHPPVRDYYFDPLFTNPSNLPPGTPMFKDVNNLSYRQDFTARPN